MESASVEGGGEVGGEGVEDPAVLGGEVTAGQGEHEVVADGVDLVGRIGRVDAGAVGGLDRPAVGRFVAAARRRRARRPAEVRDEGRERVGFDDAAGQRRQRLGFGAGAGGLGGAAGGDRRRGR